MKLVDLDRLRNRHQREIKTAHLQNRLFTELIPASCQRLDWHFCRLVDHSILHATADQAPGNLRPSLWDVSDMSDAFPALSLCQVTTDGVGFYSERELELISESRRQELHFTRVASVICAIELFPEAELSIRWKSLAWDEVVEIRIDFSLDPKRFPIAYGLCPWRVDRGLKYVQRCTVLPGPAFDAIYERGLNGAYGLPAGHKLAVKGPLVTYAAAGREYPNRFMLYWLPTETSLNAYPGDLALTLLEWLNQSKQRQDIQGGQHEND